MGECISRFEVKTAYLYKYYDNVNLGLSQYISEILILSRQIFRSFINPPAKGRVCSAECVKMQELRLGFCINGHLYAEINKIFACDDVNDFFSS